MTLRSAFLFASSTLHFFRNFHAPACLWQGAGLRARAELACSRGGHWLWPGIALTTQRGAEIVPVPRDIALYWITKLHGPQALYSQVLNSVDLAAQRLTADDEPGARKTLGGSGLPKLSADGFTLMRALAKALEIEELELPWHEGPRLFGPREIETLLPLFKQFAPAAELLSKAGGWDESKHPRVPRGSPGAGQFGSGGGEGGSDPVVEGRSVSEGDKTPKNSPEKPVQLPELLVKPPRQPKPKGKATPPLGEPPKIPEQEPLTTKLKHAFVKQATNWLRRAAIGAAFGPAGEYFSSVVSAAHTTAWLYDKMPMIQAALDRPKSLEDLQSAVGSPRKGYEVHHIVEKSSAGDDGFSREQIDGPDNVVSIPTLKHWQITGWYMTPNERFKGLSPRAYLRGKRWQERRRVGLDALIDAGVLEP